MHIISQDLIDRIIGALEESGELWCETCKMIIDDDNWGITYLEIIIWLMNTKI